MKKKVLLPLAIGGLLCGTPGLKAQNDYAASADTQLWNFSEYREMDVLNLFVRLVEEGRKFPTDEEFMQASGGIHPEFLRSHVAKREVLRGSENPRLFPNLREGRTVFMNLPSGVNKVEGGYPSGSFDNDNYNLWQYIDLWGSWNHGFFQSPGVWADAAHKHGVDMMSGIKFFDTTGNVGGVSSAGYERQILQKNSDGSFKYTKPLIHLLMYLGQDGINYNWESSGYTGAEVVAFHKSLRNYAQEVGFTNYRQAIYTSRSSLNSDYANAWLWDGQKHIGDIMLNYSGANFADTRGSSANMAFGLTGSYDHLYSGMWIVSMKRAFSSMESNSNTNLCLWGEHAQSRFYSYNNGTSATNKMANLNELYERAFSGGSKNAGKKDSWGNSDWNDRLSSFGGMSRMIPERTTLKQDLPFQTYFNTGAGERYYYKGKTAANSGWYNMASQDYQPTYRWLQYQRGTKNATNAVNVAFTYEDAYMGGTALELKGATSSDIILYRGLLTVGEANPVAKVPVKTATTSKTAGVSLLLHKRGDADTDYKIYPLSDLQGASWEEQELVLSDFSKGDVIDLIGLRMETTGDAGYHMYVGGIGLYDDRKDDVAPSRPYGLIAEVKKETTKSMAVKMTWKVDALSDATPERGDYGMIFNKDAGIDHFEFFYKNGENGKVIELGRTTSWGTYIPEVKFEYESGTVNAEQPYFGVRSVGKDLKTASNVTWLEVPRAESFELPPFVEDRYCATEIDNNSAGADIARRNRFITKAWTTGASQNLNYTATNAPADGRQYVRTSDSPIKAEQGSSFTLHYRVYDGSDGLKFCWSQAYIDWNGNGVFEPELNEAIKALSLGTERAAYDYSNAQGTVTIPQNAKPGLTRLRIVFTDAWFPKPTPCMQTQKGFSIDFDLEITGDKPYAEYVDPRDAGDVTTDPDLMKLTSVEEVVENPAVEVLKVYPNPTTGLLHVDGASAVWVYTLDGKLVKQVSDQDTIDLSDLAEGVYVVKTLSNSVMRSTKVVKK